MTIKFDLISTLSEPDQDRLLAILRRLDPSLNPNNDRLWDACRNGLPADADGPALPALGRGVAWGEIKQTLKAWVGSQDALDDDLFRRRQERAVNGLVSGLPLFDRK